jgi:hypothetical protein
LHSYGALRLNVVNNRMSVTVAPIMRRRDFTLRSALMRIAAAETAPVEVIVSLDPCAGF